MWFEYISSHSFLAVRGSLILYDAIQMRSFNCTFLGSLLKLTTLYCDNTLLKQFLKLINDENF